MNCQIAIIFVKKAFVVYCFLMVVSFWKKVLKKSTQGILILVHAVPASKEFALSGDEWKASLVVRLRAKPERGKANKELLQEMKKFFQARVELAKGEKSSEKLLLVHAPKKRVLQRLSSL